MSVSLSRVVAGVMNWGAWGASLSTIAMSELISQCVERGVTSFDHADIYGDYTTEGQWGAAFQHSGARRADIQIVTKCGIKMPAPARPSIGDKHYDTSRAHIVASVENSLRELKTDYIDLLLIHRPSPLMDAEAIQTVVADLVSTGKILHFGVSNFTPSQMRLLASKTTVAANQIELSPMALEPFTDGTLDYCLEYAVRPMAWSPLAGGKLFGQVADPQSLATRARLLTVADKYGWALDELVYRFLLHHPSQVCVVTGSSKIERIQRAVDASKVTITDSQWFEIYTASTGREVA